MGVILSKFSDWLRNTTIASQAATRPHRSHGPHPSHVLRDDGAL